MREIKFRQYCETDYGNEMVYYLSENFDNGLWFQAVDSHIHKVLSPPTQFTGLKDRDGIEIYEGDILKNEKSTSGNFFVKFNVGGYDAVYKNNFTLCLHPVLHYHDGASIIGNIYQNPELIEIK